MGSENAETGSCDGRIDRAKPTILNATKVSQGNRISLVKEVEEAFAERGIEIEEGDRVVYKLYGEHVVIEPAESPPKP